MTARSVTLAVPARRRRPDPFLGFGTIFRKELVEWVRSRRALVVLAVMVPVAVLSTLEPFLVPADEAAAGGLVLSMDPTTNVLIGWTGVAFAIVSMLAAMTLMTTERERGTLAWSLTNPVSPTSIISAKWSAAMIAYGTVAVALPLIASTMVATIAYGAVPDLAVVARLGVLYLMVPAFWIGLMIALGTGIRATAGVVGIGFLVLLAPTWLGGMVPIIGDASPAAIGSWAVAAAAGTAASTVPFAGWCLSMVVIAVAAKLLVDRQEF